MFSNHPVRQNVRLLYISIHFVKFFVSFLYETPAKVLLLEEFSCSLWPDAISRSGRAGLYETPAEGLLLAVFQYSLWPDAISRSGRAGYMKLPPKAFSY